MEKKGLSLSDREWRIQTALMTIDERKKKMKELRETKLQEENFSKKVSIAVMEFLMAVSFALIIILAKHIATGL